MNIIVADDEPLALDDIIALLQPLAASHHIRGFRRGDEVLEHARSSDVDLLITEIRMAGMDGLELIRRLREQTPDVAAIVLSEQREFEYARAGLRLGVADYLLKPVKAERLCQVVERVLAERATEQAARRHAREMLLAQALLGRPGSAADSPLVGDWGIVVTICQNWEGDVTWQTTAVDHEFVRRAAAVDRPDRYDILELDGHCRVVLVPSGQASLRQVELLALRLHNAILSTGVVVHTAYDLRRNDDPPQAVLRRTLDRLGVAMRLGISTFVRLDYGPNVAAGHAPLASRQHLAHSLAQGSTSTTLDVVHAALDQLRRRGAPQVAIVQALDNVFDALRHSTSQDIAGHLPVHERVMAVVRACRTYQELEDWVDEQMRASMAQEQGSTTPVELVARLAALVQTSYWQGISLRSFAAEHSVSLAYFSRLFKQQVGMTFSDYQIQVRIARAKELLAREDLRLADISALVGYSDPKYFSQVFRKVVGVSPQDYRRSHQEERSSPYSPTDRPPG